MYTATIRLPDDLAEMIKAAAEREGTTLAQYMRDAAYIRMAQGLNSQQIAELAKRIERLEDAVGIER